MLASTGVAGKPASYFYGSSIADWLADLELAVIESLSESDILKSILRTVLHAGRNGSRLFGLRQQAHGLAFLCQKLALLYPDEVSDAARFQRAFGATLFIHLTRSDKVEQAVSLLKARQTGLWHVAPDGSELERVAPHRAPVYDADLLRTYVETVTAYDREWIEWFAREGIEPFRITYDQLAADPVDVLRLVLDRLGLDLAAASGITPGVRKLADNTSQDWVARFRAAQLES